MLEHFTTHLASFEITPPLGPAEFYPFSRLPSEIRLKIWAIALSEPRKLTIKCKRPPFKRGVPRAAQAFKANLHPPALLHVCRETRFEALNIYKPHFKTSRAANNTFVSTRGHIYVCFTQDTLRLEQSILPLLAETELQAIQRLHFDVKDPGYFGHLNMGTVTKMRALKELDIWAEQGDVYGWNPSWETTTNNYAITMLRNFEEAKEIDPGWECPAVRIFNKDTNLQLGNVDAGALIPGWVAENLPENQDDTAFRI